MWTLPSLAMTLPVVSVLGSTDCGRIPSLMALAVNAWINALTAVLKIADTMLVKNFNVIQCDEFFIQTVCWKNSTARNFYCLSRKIRPKKSDNFRLG